MNGALVNVVLWIMFALFIWTVISDNNDNNRAA